jgi:glycosyltransferase involved in cell wall biosynthesis
MQNRGLFSRHIIITSTKDHATQQLASYYDVEIVKTDIFFEGGKFNKFKGMNVGLEKASKKDWVLFLDADIVLPPITKRVFKELQLNQAKLYGIDRFNCIGFQEWVDYCNHPDLVQNNWLVGKTDFRLGHRISHYYGYENNTEFQGYKPLGFFQLAHSSQFTQYPDDCPNAAHCDLVFSEMWPRTRRELIPEIFGIHLMSEDEWGKDWNGRKTKQFNKPTLTYE